MGRPSGQDIRASIQGADDFALMELVRAKDSAALAALYDRYGSVVFTLCQRALRDPRDAEDLLIDIFCEVWEKSDRFDPLRGSPLGYLMGLSRSRIVDRIRSRQTVGRVKLETAINVEDASDLRGNDPNPLASAIDTEQSALITQAVQTLPPEQRQALELAYFESLSHVEVAQRLGQPLGTVKSRIRQALLHLRARLGRGG